MDEQEAPIESLGAADEYLRTKVDAANQGIYDMPITLLVGGMLITGHTVGADAYYQHVTKQFLDNAQIVVQGVKAGKEHTEEVIRHVRASLEDDSKLPSPLMPDRFIHLRDVQISMPFGCPLNLHPDKWWRIRLDKVDGWMQGHVLDPEG